MTKHLTFAALLLMSLSACSAGATLVRKDQTGGTVQLEGAYMRAMSDARLMMVEHCRGRIDMVELGDSVEFRCRRPVRTYAAADLAVAGSPAPPKPGL
jgi:hypothetical protein